MGKVGFLLIILHELILVGIYVGGELHQGVSCIYLNLSITIEKIKMIELMYDVFQLI